MNVSSSLVWLLLFFFKRKRKKKIISFLNNFPLQYVGKCFFCSFLPIRRSESASRPLEYFYLTRISLQSFRYWIFIDFPSSSYTIPRQERLTKRAPVLNGTEQRRPEMKRSERDEERRGEKKGTELCFVFGLFFFSSLPLQERDPPHLFDTVYVCVCVCVKRNTWKYTQRQWFRNKTQSEKRERDEPLIHHENVIVLLFVSCLISFLLTTAFSSFKGTCALVFFFVFF